MSISTEGQCPALASVMREELQDCFGPEYADAVQVFGDLRRQMIASRWSSPQIRAAIRGLYKAGLIDMIRAGDRAAASALITERLGEGFIAGGLI